jgi:anti-anti-sigma factor
MAAPQGILSMHQNGSTVYFRVEGWGRMAQGLALRRTGDKCLAGGATILRVDLRRCTYLDSTFLGTLLYLQRAIRCKPQGEFALVCPSPECCKLLDQMDLEDFFNIVTTVDDAAPSNWTQLCCEMESPESFKPKVIDAHKELACLPGKAGEVFREVVHGLEKDQQAQQAK